jgi:excisionase family DNA binding protein
MPRSHAGGRPLAYTPDEAAELLRVSPSLIRTLVRTGALPRVAGLGRAIRIPSRALYEFVGERVPDLPSTLEIEPAEAPEPRPPVPERTPPPARAASPVIHRPVRRPAEPRPRPSAPEGPIRVDEQRLWLLGDSSQYRLLTWHIGTDQAVCGRRPEGRWKRSATRSPHALMCPACLTTVARAPGVEMGSIPITAVCMVRETRRGDSVTLIKSGWHLGNGRVTSCGKRDGPWHLTEREPQKEVCFVCGERRSWEREGIKGSLESESAGKPRFTVLLDQSVSAAEVEALARRAPGFLAVRHASRALTPEAFDHYDRGLHELFGAAQVVPGTSGYSWQWAPDITLTADAHVLAASQDRPFVMTQAAFVEWVAPQVERAEKAKVLRDRWDREASARTRSSRGWGR